MTQKEKELLIKDLCGRLSYKVKVTTTNAAVKFGVISGISIENKISVRTKHADIIFDCTEVKPYLFPLSSMTEEQKEELITITNGKFRYMCGDINNAIPRKNTSEWGIDENAYINSIKVINILYIWLLKNHFDINRLIPKGFALDATGLNIY